MGYTTLAADHAFLSMTSSPSWKKLAVSRPKFRMREIKKAMSVIPNADTSRAREELLYEPKISIGEGLRREFEWLEGILG